MSTTEWIGLFIFLIILTLLFFAAFGGTNITEQSVDDYIKRLMGQTEEKKWLWNRLALIAGRKLSLKESPDSMSVLVSKLNYGNVVLVMAFGQIKWKSERGCGFGHSLFLFFSQKNFEFFSKKMRISFFVWI